MFLELMNKTVSKADHGVAGVGEARKGRSSAGYSPSCARRWGKNDLVCSQPSRGLSFSTGPAYLLTPPLRPTFRASSAPSSPLFHPKHRPGPLAPPPTLVFQPLFSPKPHSWPFHAS